MPTMPDDAIRFTIEPKGKAKDELPWYAKAALWSFMAWGAFKIITHPIEKEIKKDRQEY